MLSISCCRQQKSNKNQKKTKKKKDKSRSEIYPFLYADKIIKASVALCSASLRGNVLSAQPPEYPDALEAEIHGEQRQQGMQPNLRAKNFRL